MEAPRFRLCGRTPARLPISSGRFNNAGYRCGFTPVKKKTRNQGTKGRKLPRLRASSPLSGLRGIFFEFKGPGTLTLERVVSVWPFADYITLWSGVASGASADVGATLRISGL